MAIKDRGSDADRQTHFDKWSGIVIQNYAVITRLKGVNMKDKVLEQCLLIVLEHLQETGTSAMVGTLEQAIKEIERLESKNNDIEFIRTEKIDTEKIMKQWDAMRKRIAEGDKSSAPSDWFASVIDSLTEQIAQRSDR